MITIKDFMEVVDYRITEGSEYQWLCWGYNAYSLDSWNGVHDGHTVSIVFDTKTQVVYMSSACDYRNQRAYRWFNPEFEAAYRAECSSRGCDDHAWDHVAWTDLDVPLDFLEKARNILQDLEYDARVQVPLEFDRETMYNLMQQAHLADLSLNQYVEQLLTQTMAGESVDNLS